jgi:hypothetical protein
VLVGNGNDKTIEAAPLQFGAQGVQAGFVGLHQHGNTSLGMNGD